MAKAKYFTQNNEKVYPISHTKAVYDGNGKVLEDRLTEDETAISSLQTDVKSKANKTDVDNKLSSNSAISDTTVAFTEASVKENIVSNEKSSILFGKVQKWFSDLKTVAFTGSYSDLIDTPSNATTSANGLMSSSDKTKLNGIASNANNYVHPTTSGNKHIPSGGSSGQILKWSADGTATWSTLSNATSSSPGLMSATDKQRVDDYYDTIGKGGASRDFLSCISENDLLNFEFHENLTFSGGINVNEITFNLNHYATLTEITSDLYDMYQKNIDNGFDFIGNMAHNTSSKRFEFSATDPLYISSSQGGKWYYDGNEIATKSDIPSTSDFLKTSGGTLSGNTTLTSGYGFLSSYSSNLKLLRVNSNSNYFGEQVGATAMYNYFGYRNSANTTTITNHFGSSYNSSYKTSLTNYYGRYAATNYFGSSATTNYFGDSSTTSYYRGNAIYLGGSISYPVYMQGSTSYRVVGTTTGYNTKIHVASSQPSNMAVGDIWFKIPS